MKSEFITSRKIRIQSGNKGVMVTKYGSYWSMKHEVNGLIKNFDTYQEVVDHLQQKGW